MKMDVVAGSQNDEFYTPPIAVKPILKFIDIDAHVWCPFDTEESHFVKMLRERGNRVLATHKNTGVDFFSLPLHKAKIDYVVSNPPYTLKSEVLAALFNSGLRFAMLVGVVGLFESQKRFSMFKNANFEIMYFNKRISYLKNYTDQKPAINPLFSSVYVCSRVLPKQIVFEEL